MTTDSGEQEKLPMLSLRSISLTHLRSARILAVAIKALYDHGA
jgi:hypothetical protein